MDPITIVVVAALLLAGSGAGLAVARGRRAARKQSMRQAVRTAIALGSHAPVSLFDVFWDLGASDFALSMLASRKLLLPEPEDLRLLVEGLPAAVAEHGSYKAFITEQLEAIQEYYGDHRAAGNRRAVFALAAPVRKALPAAGPPPDVGSALRVASDAERAGLVLDRRAWRSGDAPAALTGTGGSIDVDQVTGVDVGRLLGSIFDGSIGREAKRWFAMRDARTRREELDRALHDLYVVYASFVRPDPTTTTHLYDAARRWGADATRVNTLLIDPPFAKEPWALCATVLLEEAHRMALALAAQAQANIDQTLAHIDALGHGGQTAMAGYLVYVNRHALFVARMQLCQREVGAIEAALARLQTELGGLQRKGLL